MTYRFLEPEEYGVVELIYRGQGHEKCFPTPETAKVAVVEHEGKIVSMMVGQLLLQMGPVWVDPEHKGEISLRRLHRMHEYDLRQGSRYFAFADNDTVAGLCKAGGMEEMQGWRVFRKELP